MKVLYFHQHYTDPQGSVGVRSYAMSRALSDRGHTVCIVCGSYSGGSTGLEGPFKNGVRRGFVSDNIEIVELGLSYSNKSPFFNRVYVFLRYAFSSCRLALKSDYDLIFATSTPLTVAIPGIIARWVRGKAFIFEVRDLWPELPKAMGVIKNPIVIGLMSFLERLSYKSAHHIVALSPGIRDGILGEGISDEKVSLIPNGCDLDIFSNVIDGWRPQGVSHTDFMALYAGTHGVANGLDSVLIAAQELQRRGRDDIKIVLIGDGKNKERLVRQAANDGLSNIIFHEAVSKMELRGLMSTANIGLQILANIPAFYYGTSPNKFFDYISSGLPVLNNYPGWLAELIDEYECGYTVPPDNSKAFADALEEAADNLSDLGLKAGRAKELAVARFDRKNLAIHFVDKLEAVFKEKATC